MSGLTGVPVRYESVLQILGSLKRSYGTSVTILGLSHSIDLSYQPTHKHLRTLDEHGVVELTKSGREVHCRLRRTTACAVWLALHSLQEHRRLLQAEGVTGALATSLSQTLSRCDCSGLQALALLEPETPEAAPAIVLMACDEQSEELQRRFAARSHAVDQRIEVQAYTVDQVATLSATQRREWVVRGCALYGEQRFWQLTLQPTV